MGIIIPDEILTATRMTTTSTRVPSASGIGSVIKYFVSIA